MVREDHPLAALDEITVKDLRNIPLILIGRQRPNRMALDQVFKKAGVKPMVKIETHTNSSACAYVAHGLGVTIISSFYANLYRHLPVVARPSRRRRRSSVLPAPPGRRSPSLRRR